MPRRTPRIFSLSLALILGLIGGLIVTVTQGIDQTASALCAEVTDPDRVEDLCYSCEATEVSADGLTVRFVRTDNRPEPATIRVNGVPKSEHRFQYGEFRTATIGENGNTRQGRCGLPALSGPTVRCSVTSQFGPGGSQIGFAYTTTLDDGDGYLQEWTFPDGTTSTASSVSKTATLPGPYAATIRLYRTDGSLDMSNTCVAQVESPVVGMSIRIEHDDPSDTSQELEVGEEFNFVISLTASGGIGDVSNIFTDAKSEGVDPANPEFVVIASSYVPPFPLRATVVNNAPAQEYRLRARATALGAFSIRVSATDILDAAGNPVPNAEQTRNFRVGGGLSVKVQADPDDLELVERADGTPAPRTVPVTVTVTNESGAPIESVRAEPALVTGVVIGKEKRIVQKTGPRVDPANNIDETDLGSLAIGESKTLSYTFEVSANGVYSVKTLILYTVEAGGASGREAAEEEIRVGFPTTLAANLRFVGDDKANKTIPSGGVTSAFLDLTNTSNTATIKIDKTRLKVTGSAGGGFLAPTEDSVPQVYLSGEIPVPRNVVIEPGETVTFDAWIYGSPGIIGRGNAFIGFEPTGTVTDRSVAAGVPEERPLVRGDIEFEDDREELKLGIAERPPVYGEQSWGDIASSLTEGFVSQSYVWLTNTFTGFAEAAQAVADGRFGLAVGDAFFHMSEMYLAYSYLSDEDRAAFVERVAVQIAEAEDSAVESVRASVEVTLDTAFKAYLDGNYTELARMTGSGTATIFWEVGMLEAGASGLLKTGQGARVLAQVSSLTRKGLAGLKTGTIISRRASNALGYAIDVVDDVSLLAKRERLNITVKPRDPDALRAVGSRQARVKPEFIKPKSVSQIDIDILGFPAGKKSLIAVRPGLKSEIPDLNELRRRFDNAGYNADLFPAVQKRYEKRLEELDKYLPELRTLDGTNVTKAFNTADNGIEGGIGVDIVKNERFDMVDIDNDGTLELQLNGKPITSDMDILSITQSNGKPLTKDQRIAVYKQLEEISDIQHPESATWIDRGDGANTPGQGADFASKRKTFEEFASDVPDNVPAIQFGGDGKLHAVRYNKNSQFITADDYLLIWDGGFRADGNIEYPISGSTVGFISNTRTNAVVAPVLAGGFSGRNGEGQSVPTVQSNGPSAQSLRYIDGSVQQYQPGASSNGAGRLQRTFAELGRNGGQWVDVLPAAFDGRTRIEVLPQTLIIAESTPGVTGVATYSRAQLSTVVSTGEELLAIDDFFVVGQTVVVDPGGPNEETAVIATLEPMTFTAPLAHAHAPGEMVVAVPAAQVVEPPPATTPSTEPPVIEPPATQPPGTSETTVPMGQLPSTGGGSATPTLLLIGMLLLALGTMILTRVRRRTDVGLADRLTSVPSGR